MGRHLKRSSPFLLLNIRKRPNRGAILFLAVGAIAVLSILALGATSNVLSELKVAKLVTDSNTSFYLASSAIKAMRVVFAHDPTPGVITLYDLQPREIPFGDRVVRLSFSDEQSKINIDTAPKAVLLRLPGIAGNEPLADAIIASDIEVKEELLLFEGMTQEIYDAMKNLIATTTNGSVNINTAGLGILFILGMDSDLTSKIQIFRAGEDAIEGTEDDRYFSNEVEIVPVLETYGLNPSQKTLLEAMISSQALSVTSDFINFDITVKKARRAIGGVGKPLRTFSILLQLTSGSIASWQES